MTKPLTGWPLMRLRLEGFCIRFWRRFGIRVVTQARLGGAERSLANCQRQLLSLCVLDLKYVEAPRYGWTPLRHQFAWDFATEGMDPSDVAKEVVDMKGRPPRTRTSR